MSDRVQVWIVESREEPCCRHGTPWQIDGVYLKYQDADNRLRRLGEAYPEWELRMRAWDLR